MRSKVRNLTFVSLVTGVALWASAASAARVAQGNNFTVDSNVASCRAGGECKVELKLSAGSGYHVNPEYPYKFKANDAGGVEFLGKDPANKTTFSKSAGDFTVDGEKVGTMTIRFRPSSHGSVTIAGVFKLSVCSAQNCQLDQANVSVPVSVN
ncbi:MAG TPA: hypothetical protein VGH28_32430 [Polyangiaceae bacterium]|jgi:hypothetical protein